MANPVADIQIHAALLDDYLYIQDQPVVPGPGRFVAVQDTAGQAPVTHLFALDSNGNLLHFRPDTSSHSGWTVNQVPHRAAGSIEGISALFHKGVLDVLISCVDRGDTVQLLRWAGGDSWGYGYYNSGLSPLMNSSTLGPNRVGLFIDSSGGRYLYGAVEPLTPTSAEVFLGCYDESIGIWCSVSGTESFPNNYGATYWMEEAEGGGVGILNCDADGGLEAWFGSITNAGGPDPSFTHRSNYNVNFGIGSTWRLS